ncbi:MAG TPA: vitamin K epoxide reductase family protein [Gemmatimonadaceae bacterium]|nr:vitamin K epoxide reductase family protein [Gemmatimonadaceae bacterium]
MLIALLALIGALVALYLTLYKVGALGEISCSIGSCETVNLSRWATFLGLPVAAWGLAAYVVLLALSLVGLQPERERSRSISLAVVLLAGWSFLFSLWLTYLELFVIRAICMWCVISAAIMTAIFALSVADLRAARRTASA